MEWTVGDQVDVKHKGRAQVAEIALGPGPHAGRCLVMYDKDGSQYWANPTKLRALTPASRRVLVCRRTGHYQAAVPHNVSAGDVVLEVGCSWGVTTAMLHKRCSYVVGVDISETAVEGARVKAPHVRFEVADGFDVAGLRTLAPAAYTRIFVDISGKANLALITRLLLLYLAEFPQSTIVVKNEALFRHLERNGQGAPCQQQQEQHESREEAAAEEQAAAGEEQRQEAAAAAQQERQATEAPGRRQQQQQEPQRGSEGRLIGWALQKQRQMHLSEEDQGLLAALEPDCQLFYPPWQ